MKKILYAIFATACAALFAFDSAAQMRLDGQPYGDLFSDAGSDSVYGTSHTLYTYGYRSSMIFRNYQAIRPVYASDSLEFIIEQKEKGQEILYGTAMRYDGPALLRSYVFVYSSVTSDVSLLLASDVSQTGTYSIQTMIGNVMYGIRTGGGTYGYGVFFKINKDGTGYTELHHFASAMYRPEKMLVRYNFNENGLDETQPQNFVGINASGGAFGKGAIITAPLNGSGFFPSVDFTGQGGLPNESGDTDGEGPVAIVQDIDTDIFVITRAGGANNKGTIFIYGMDGITNIHDFSAANGTPYTTKPFIDHETSTMYGIASNVPGRRGTIYSVNLTGGGINEQFLDLDVGVHNQVAGPIAVSKSENYLIATARRGNVIDDGAGTIFLVTQSGGQNIASAGQRFNVYPLSVSGPTDGRTDVSINTILQAAQRIDATQYTFLLSEDSEFSEGTVLTLVAEPGARQVQCPRLKYNTTYWVRVKTNLNFFGPRTSFTTSTAEKYSFVTNPGNGATDIVTDNLKVTANIVYGATSYTIELNTSSDFTGTSIVKTSAVANQRTLTFNGLTPGTTYYNRTMTNLPSGWGPTRSFTTAIAPPPMQYVAEANTAGVSVYPNPFARSFTVANENSEIPANAVLIDMTGREVNAAALDINSSMELGEELPSGMYLLKIQTGSQITTKRMIKQ